MTVSVPLRGEVISNNPAFGGWDAAKDVSVPLRGEVISNINSAAAIAPALDRFRPLTG